MATYGGQTNSSRTTPSRGWPVVVAAAVGLFLSFGTIVVLSFGVYLKPLSADFHATRTAISLAFTIQSVVTAVSIPWIGRLVDRSGARIVILAGTALFGVVLISSEFVSGQIAYLYVLFGALGIIGCTTSPVPYGVVISRWFDRRRGLALGLTACGLGLGAIVMPLISQRLIAAFGWRNSFAYLGAATILFVLPVLGKFLAERPEQIAPFPEATTGAAIRRILEADDKGLSWGEIRSERAFWLLICAYFLAAASLFGCVVHLPAMITDRGGSAASGAGISSVVGVALLAGRFGTGILLDRVFAPRLTMIVFGGAAIGVGMLLAGISGVPALAAAFLLGLAMGAEVDIIAFLMSRYFGLRALGTSFGFGFASYALASAVGVFLMGAGFDATHAYTLPLSGCAASMLVAILLIGRLGPYRYTPRDPAFKTNCFHCHT